MNHDQRLRVIVDALETAAVGVVITDRDGHIVWVNSAFMRASGYSRDEAVGRRPGDLVRSGEQGADFYRDLWQTILAGQPWRGEIVNRRKDGQRHIELMTVSPLRDESGAITHFIAVKQDITKQRLLEIEVDDLTWCDPVTGLANRRHATERLGRMLVSGGPAGYAALLHLDLDEFSAINAISGHECGDRLLQQVAQRLSTCLPPHDHLARIGGDDFLVIALGLGNQRQVATDAAMAKGNTLLRALAEPFSGDAGMHHLSASVGIALSDSIRPDNTAELIKQAEIAMYHAKNAAGLRISIYEDRMGMKLESHVATVSAIREALARREFILFYQPQLDYEGRLVGAEALARWRHPEHGVIAPNDFLAVAEQTDLMDELGTQLVTAVCEDLRHWESSPAMAGLPVAVNISPSQFHKPGFCDHLRGLLAAAGLEPQRLTLEVTENLLFGDLAQAIRTMQCLRRDGFRLSLDDFGTGYASLAYLKRLPLDELKIDRSFVRDMREDPDDAAIVRMILALAQAMDLAVVAEGVENENVLEDLVAMGCRRFQGYLFARPMSPEEFAAFAESRRTVDYDHAAGASHNDRR